MNNGLWHTLSTVNNHLQPTAYWDAVSDNSSSYLRMEYPNWTNSEGQNNGNLQGTAIWVGGPAAANLTQFSETFGYDGENRLTSATDSGGWSRNFSYDQWGNMAVTGNNGVPAMNVNTPQSLGLFNANNQRTDQSYDVKGNLQSVQPGIALTYDAENRQMAAGGYSYAYDGNGRRVSKTGGGNTTVYVYDAAGELAAEYNVQAQPAAACTTCYLSYDHLGSVRMVTDANAKVISRHDYLPFGEEIPVDAAGRVGSLGFGNADYVSQRFTGKERDSESGLDYFGARYYGASLGRWTGPDPKQISVQRMNDPQQWNMYSYVRNNAYSGVDPDGKELHIIIVNHANLSQEVLATSSAGIAQKYRDAGVQNVTIQYRDSIPSSALNNSGVDRHTVYLEFQKNHNGQVQIDRGNDGQNPPGGWETFWTGRNELGGPGGSAAGVETTSPGTIPPNATEKEAIDGLTAVGAHETAHKFLPGVGNKGKDGDRPDDIMNHGQSALQNVPFSGGEAQHLREVLNTPAEQKQYESQQKKQQ